MARKSPAFSFYPDSWFTGTMLMTPAQKGIYIDLLAIQWVKGGFSKEQATLVLRGATEEDLEAVLADKFEEVETNWFLNPRLQEEQEKQEKRRVQLSENGKKGGRPKKQVESKAGSKTEPDAKATEKPSVSVSVSDSVLDSSSASKQFTELRSVCVEQSSPPAAEEGGVKPGEEPCGLVLAMQSGTYHLKTKELAAYVATYRFDVKAELMKASMWLRDNKPRRPRTPTGVRQFLTRWLNRCDESKSSNAKLGGKIPTDDRLKAEMARASRIRAEKRGLTA